MGPEERKIFIAFIVVAGFIALVVGLFFYYIFKQQHRYRKLQKEKLNAEIQAAEIERNELATQLHNDIAPYLSSIRMRLQLLDEDTSGTIAENITALDACIQKIRHISKQLSPLTTFDLSFKEALEHYSADLKTAGLLQIHIIEKNTITVTSETNSQVYRILQEIIANTLKHANATTLTLELSSDNDELFIRTADNGIGFNLHTVRKSTKRGLGLLSIYSRVDYLNGTIAIDSGHKKQSGVKFNIRIPLSS